jgi:AraC-like DNA-binding protein
MALLRYRPGPPLDQFVDCFWRSEREEPQTASEHNLPTGAAYLTFSLTGESKAGIVHGPQSSFYVSGPKPKGAAIGIAFRPGAAGAILGVPMAEIADHHAPIEAFWGKRASELHERLCADQDAQAAFRVLEEQLSSRIHKPLLMHPAVAMSLRPPWSARSRIRIAELERQAGYSARHFISLFRAAVGLTPRQFYRIRRFSVVLRALTREKAELAELAIETGYADQSHMTREFRELSGTTPTRYNPPTFESPHHHLI